MDCLLASIFNGFWWVGEPFWKGKSTQDRSKIDPEGHQKNDREKRPSWKRLGAVLGFQNPPTSAARGCTRLVPGAVAETQGPLLGRIPEGLEY